MPADEVSAGAAASEGVPRDPKGSFTRGTPEAHACSPQVAKEAAVLEERLE
jgi:hypothetical protein